MNDQRDGLSPQRTELLRHILKKPSLEYCHERYPGAIRLVLVRRTRAVLMVRERQVRYHLSEPDHGAAELTADTAKSTRTLQQSHPALWSLGFHVAAEAMLALRNGHKEFVDVKRRKSKADIT